jgi:hypothetical protein
VDAGADELVAAAGVAALVDDVAAAADVELELDELLPHAATATTTSADSTRARRVRPATTRIEILSSSLRTSDRGRNATTISGP